MIHGTRRPPFPPVSLHVDAFDVHDVHETYPASICPTVYYDKAPHYVRPSDVIGHSTDFDPWAHPAGVVFKHSYPKSEKRLIEAEMYNVCGGQFAVPTHIASFEPCRSDGAAFSNSIFLPSKTSGTSFSSYRWYPSATSESESDPSPPDYRTLVVTVTEDEGKSLEHCESAWDLAECLLHAHLGKLSALVSRDRLTYDVTMQDG